MSPRGPRVELWLSKFRGYWFLEKIAWVDDPRHSFARWVSGYLGEIYLMVGKSRTRFREGGMMSKKV